MEELNTMEAPESTISQESTNAEPDTSTEGVSEAPQAETDISSAEGSENDGGSTAGSDTSSEDEPFLKVVYNHEDKGLTREEAKTLSQIGMKVRESGRDFSVLNALYNKLDYVAAQRECSIDKLVDDMIASDEKAYRDGLAEKFGGECPEIDDLMKLYHQKQKDKYDKVLSDRKNAAESDKTAKQQALEERLADEFIELKKEFPELSEFSAIPERVKQEAANGRDLLSAYLRYTHCEQKKIKAAEEAQRAAEKAGAGRLSSAGDGEDSVVSAFLQSFNS